MNDFSNSMPQMGHRLELIGREQLTVSGVEDVERFDETGIVMSTGVGTLVITGEDLHIGKLSLDGGELHVDGRIDAISYEEGGQEQGGFFRRLFGCMAAALLYDLLRAFRLRLRRLTGVLDILYCILAGTAVFLFTLYRARGQMSLLLLLGLAGGAAVFFRFLSRPLQPVWTFWVDTLAFLLHLIAIPLRGMERLCKKIAGHGKNLFYFIRKCYTIKTTRGNRRLQKGGRRRGKGKKAAKAKIRRQHHHQGPDPGDPGGHRRAAAKPPRSGAGRRG